MPLNFCMVFHMAQLQMILSIKTLCTLRMSYAVAPLAPGHHQEQPLLDFASFLITAQRIQSVWWDGYTSPRPSKDGCCHNGKLRHAYPL